MRGFSGSLSTDVSALRQRVLYIRMTDETTGRTSDAFLPDYLARVVRRDESVFSWFLDAYDVPDAVRDVISGIAEHPEVRPAGITLKRMKQRGWYAPTTFKLWALSFQSAPGLLASPVYGTFLRFSDVTGVADVNRPDKDSVIPDAVWLDAIELVMMCNHFEEYLDSVRRPSTWNWTSTLRDDLPMIYFVVYLLKSREDYYDTIMAQRKRLGEVEAELERHLDSVSDLISVAEADERADAVRSKYRADLDAVQAENARLRKYIAALEHANEDLIRAADALDASAAASGAACASADDSEGEDTSDLSDASEGLSEPSEGVLPELPDTGVVFMGGHTRVVRQLRQLHPDWKFVDAGSSAGVTDFGPSSNVSVVFCWYKHLTHPVFERVTSALEGVPVAYVSATNIARLETEMRVHYFDILKKLEV